MHRGKHDMKLPAAAMKAATMRSPVAASHVGCSPAAAYAVLRVVLTSCAMARPREALPEGNVIVG